MLNAKQAFQFIRLHATEKSRFFALLDSANITAPDAEEFKRSQQDLPFMAGGRKLAALLSIKGQSYDYWDMFEKSKPSRESVRLQTVFGCLVSVVI